jgi:hypothetical protein
VTALRAAQADDRAHGGELPGLHHEHRGCHDVPCFLSLTDR